MKYSDLRNVRNVVYFDWGIRDLVIRSVIHLYNKGFNKQRIDEFIEYLLRKIREDYNHITAVLQVADIFRRKGCEVVLTELRNKLFDLLVITPSRILFIEVKPTPPPWCGLNKEELESYKTLPYSTFYVWKDRSGWKYTIQENLEVRNKCLYVKSFYDLSVLLGMVK